jgi:hypothetical protein
MFSARGRTDDRLALAVEGLKILAPIPALLQEASDTGPEALDRDAGRGYDGRRRARVSSRFTNVGL